MGKSYGEGIQFLINRNEEFKIRFNENLLFRLMRSQRLNSIEQRDRFLSYFQVWSNSFQKAVLLKTALCDDPHFIPSFMRHFHEELGHDQLLSKDRRHGSLRKDSILEAVCLWFPSKMLSLNAYEQTLIMNLVVEGSAVVFYKNAQPILDPEGKMDHFVAHSEDLDSSHERLGLDLLEGLSIVQMRRLAELQTEAWDMLETLMNRLGELCTQK